MWARLNNIITRKFPAVIILFVTTVIARCNIFSNQFILDDFDYIVNWPLIQDLANWPKFFVGFTPPPGQDGIYSPLKTFFHALNYHLFEVNVFGYHVESILVHAIGVICVYFICRILSKSPVIAFWSAFIFSIHPVQVELTVSMTGSVDLIGIVFMLASMLFYLQYLENKKKRRRFFLISCLTGMIGVFTHELVISLPILLLWCDMFFRQRNKFWRERVFALMPFFCISLFYAYAKAAVLGSVTRNTYLYDSFYLTMLVSLKALGQYVLISFFPFVLTHNHQLAPGIFSFDNADFDSFAVLSQSPFDPYSFLSILILCLVSFGAWRAWPRYRFLVFAAGWFFIGLLPGLNIIPSGVYFAERYLYAGFGGFCIIMGWVLTKGWQKFAVNQTRLRNIYVSCLVVLFVFYLSRSLVRIPQMRNDITLFRSAVKAAPGSALMHNDLGIVYMQNGYTKEALDSFERALTIRKDPATYFAIAEVFSQIGQYLKAVDALKKAITLKPDFAEAFYNLAGLSFVMGEEEKGHQYFQKSKAIFLKQGRSKDASEYEKIWNEYISMAGK